MRGPFISDVDMATRLIAWRHGSETPWLNVAPAHPRQHPRRDLVSVDANFAANRVGFQRFKKEGKGAHFRDFALLPCA